MATWLTQQLRSTWPIKRHGSLLLLILWDGCCSPVLRDFPADKRNKGKSCFSDTREVNRQSSHLRIYGISCASLGSSGHLSTPVPALSTSESGQATLLPLFITVTLPKGYNQVIFMMRHRKDHIAPGGPGLTRGMPSVIYLDPRKQSTACAVGIRCEEAGAQGAVS